MRRITPTPLLAVALAATAAACNSHAGECDRTYVIRTEGETVSKIAQREYGAYYMAIFIREDNGQIADIDKVHAGDKICLRSRAAIAALPESERQWARREWEPIACRWGSWLFVQRAVAVVVGGILLFLAVGIYSEYEKKRRQEEEAKRCAEPKAARSCKRCPLLVKIRSAMHDACHAQAIEGSCWEDEQAIKRGRASGDYMAAKAFAKEKSRETQAEWNKIQGELTRLSEEAASATRCNKCQNLDPDSVKVESLNDARRQFNRR